MGTTNYSPAGDSARTGRYVAPRAHGTLDASLAVPGSKSLTNRELVLAALADSPSRLIAPLHSDDSARMIESLRSLGVTITEENGESPFGPDLIVTPPSSFTEGTVDCGQAGTVMRFVAPLAGLAKGDVLVTAHESALHRPMGELIKALRDLGLDIADDGRWALPFTVHGRGHIRGGELSIDASASSQFISGLLLSAARFDVGLHLVHEGEKLPSMPHIEMTIDALARRGVHVEQPSLGEWIVPAGPIRGKDVAIEPDLSNAAPFLAAALVTGGSVSVKGWPSRSTQPGILLPGLLSKMGARADRAGGVLTVTGTGHINGVDMDLSAAGELAPTFIGLATLAQGPSTFRGIGHIRQHETDRLAALVENIRAIGGEATETEDGIHVVPTKLTGGTWKAFHDHRMATTGALIGLAVDDVEIDDIGTTAKTLPQFAQLWEAMIAASDGQPA